jgi:site-specific recombinase XerD
MSRSLRPHELHIPAWLGPSELQPYIDGWVHFICQQGYSKYTLHMYRNAVAHFAHWMTVRRITVSVLDETLIKRFICQHLPKCRCGPLCQRQPHVIRAALKILLRYLRGQGVVRAARCEDPESISEELRAFGDYQEHVCGLTDTTRAVSRLRLRAFLLAFFADRPIRISALTAADVKRFINRHTRNFTPVSRATFCRSIRGYLHFKALKDPYAEFLCERLPKFANWRLASIPKALSQADSEAILAACKGSDPVSRRDYAILRCLNDLGLRTLEVARLQVDDFDWAAGTVRIRGKGHRVDAMPIPIATAEAIIAYIRQGRPRNVGRALFFRHRPPHWAPATAFVVRAAVRQAAKRAGLADHIGGPHIFRHTLAERLVQKRASLKAIADVLRHRSLISTRIYAKVDLQALSAVAARWPGRHL